MSTIGYLMIWKHVQSLSCCMECKKLQWFNFTWDFIVWSKAYIAHHIVDTLYVAKLSVLFSCFVIHTCQVRANGLYSYLLSFHWFIYVNPRAACRLRPLPWVVFNFLNTMSLTCWPEFVLQISSSLTHPKLQELSTGLSCMPVGIHWCTVIALNLATANF